MKQTNIVLTDISLNNIKQVGAPVTVKRLSSPGQKVVFFYNSSRGSSTDTNFVTSIKGIKSNNTANFDVPGTIKGLKEKEDIDSYGSRKSLR